MFPSGPAAKRLDKKKKDTTTDTSKKEEMFTKSNGAKTVPQIFIDGTLVGGYTDLIEKFSE